MSYSLGDDKESFDVFERTQNFVKQIGNKLIEKGWVYDDEQNYFRKDERNLKFDTYEDDVTAILISDDSIDYKKIADKCYWYETVYGMNDEINCIEINVFKDTNINKIVNDLEYAPLKEKNNDIEI